MTNPQIQGGLQRIHVAAGSLSRQKKWKPLEKL
jgi:hypothetical protein